MEIYCVPDFLERLRSCIEVICPRKRGIIEYNHHIFVGKVEKNGCVISHYSGSLISWFKCRSLGQITRERLNFSSEEGIHRMKKLFGFENGQKAIIVERDDYPNYRNAEERIINRANRRLGEMRYSIVFNNCESFINWIFSGDNTSVEFDTAPFLKKAFAFHLDALTRKGPVPPIMFADALIRKNSLLPFILFEPIVLLLEKLYNFFRQDFENENEENEETDTCAPHLHEICFVSLEKSFVFKQPFHFKKDEGEENQKTSDRNTSYQRKMSARIRIQYNEPKFKCCSIKHTNTATNELPASLSDFFSGIILGIDESEKKKIINVSETSFLEDIWKKTFGMPESKSTIAYTTALYEATSLLKTSYIKYGSAFGSHEDMMDEIEKSFTTDILSTVGSTCGCKCGSEIAIGLLPFYEHSAVYGCLGGYYIGSGVGLIASMLI